MKKKSLLFNLFVSVTTMFVILFVAGCSNGGSGGGGRVQENILDGTSWLGEHGEKIISFFNTRGEISFCSECDIETFSYTLENGIIYVETNTGSIEVPYSGGNTFVYDGETFTKIDGSNDDNIAAALIGTWADDIGNTYQFNLNKTGINSDEDEFKWEVKESHVTLTFEDEPRELIYPGGDTWNIFGNEDVFTKTSGPQNSVVGTAWEIDYGSGYKETVRFKQDGTLEILKIDNGTVFDDDSGRYTLKDNNMIDFINISYERFRYGGGNTFTKHSQTFTKQ